MENVILRKIIDYGVFFSKEQIFGMLFYSLPIAQLERGQMLCYFHDSNYQKKWNILQFSKHVGFIF